MTWRKPVEGRHKTHSPAVGSANIIVSFKLAPNGFCLGALSHRKIPSKWYKINFPGSIWASTLHKRVFKILRACNTILFDVPEIPLFVLNWHPTFFLPGRFVSSENTIQVYVQDEPKLYEAPRRYLKGVLKIL